MFDLRISVRTVWVPGVGDVTIVRNIADGAYVEDHLPHRKRRHRRRGRSRSACCPRRVREVLDLAVDFAEATPGRRVHLSVDKPNVFATSRLWRRTRQERAGRCGSRLRHLNVDRAAYELVKYDELPAVIATEGIFGDILSDIAVRPRRIARPDAGPPRSTRTASSDPARPGLFEPAHGTVTAPHRDPDEQPDRRLARPGRAAGLVPRPAAPLGLGASIRDALADVHAAGSHTNDLAVPGQPSAVHLDEINQQILTALETHRG